MTQATATTATTSTAAPTSGFEPHRAPTFSVAQLIREMPAARTLGDKERMHFLPDMFPGDIRTALRFEGHVFDMMGKICRDYDGGLWMQVRLLNGGGFMYPSVRALTMQIRVPFGNYFDAPMSPMGAGIVATSLVLSRMWSPGPQAADRAERSNERIAQLANWLAEYIDERPDARTIWQALD